MRKGIAVYFLIMSTLVGAGIITGQEVKSYFGSFNTTALFCSALAALCFFVCVLISLKLSSSKKYQTLKNSKTFKAFLLFGDLAVAAAMLACLTEVQIRMVGFSFPFFIFIVAAVCFCLVIVGISFFKKINIWLSMANLIILCVLCAVALKVSAGGVGHFISLRISRAVCFSTYNIFLVVPMLEEVGTTLTKKQRLSVSVASAISVFVLIVLTSIAVSHNNSALPFLEIAAGFGFWFNIAFNVIIILAIITTLFTVLYSAFITLKNSRFWFLMFVMASIAASFVGFGEIVGYLYFIIGALALIFFVYMATKG